MARRFQTRLTIATSVLIAATIGFMSLALIHLAATTITKQHRIRGKLLTALAKRNIEYGTGLPEEVMERVGDQMVVTALLTAELVAIAEQDGSLSPERISEALSRVIERSRQHRGYPLVDEFWVTDENGYAYIHTEDFDFTFSPDPEKTPQANEFWPLLEEGAAPLVQKLQKRAVDEKRFKYVGVSGVDKPRIVQIGVGEDLVNSIQSGFLVENIVERFVEEMEIER
ncbi:MAG TPA: hypothetical protein HPP77_10920, partial [Candidatus Hydrogenedentes bacterium]|nr:hypothetical protein [Candidatus Hydrogenedentota bacterium]